MGAFFSPSGLFPAETVRVDRFPASIPVLRQSPGVKVARIAAMAS